jgi:allantoate deiminase
MSSFTLEAAQRVIDDCRALALFTEVPGNTTRTFLSPPTKDVHRFLRRRMEEIGMEVWVDAIGNLRGVYRGGPNASGRLLLGSHIDTVPDAGAFDGVLGVVMAVELVRALDGRRLDFDVEVIAFSEEEGVRFGVPFLGSRALVGDFDSALLQRIDAQGITMEQAIRDFGLGPRKIVEGILDLRTFAYVEFHIEQGPVLDSLGTETAGRHLGMVEAIVGQTRIELTFLGAANHAGTTPMNLRRDALAGAAEWLLAVEALARSAPGMVATVGEIAARPGVANVVPGAATLSLDLRHASDDMRGVAVERLLSQAHDVAQRRGLTIEHTMRMQQAAVAMDPALADQLEAAVRATGSSAHRMVSGAGHDAMVMAAKVPAAMLFLPSPGGVSHHPDESVRAEDVQAALDAGLYFLDHLQRP